MKLAVYLSIGHGDTKSVHILCCCRQKKARKQKEPTKAKQSPSNILQESLHEYWFKPMQMYHTDFWIRLELGEFDWISGAWQQNKSFPRNSSKLLHHMQKHVPLTHCFVSVLCPHIVISRILPYRILYNQRVSEKC